MTGSYENWNVISIDHTSWIYFGYRHFVPKTVPFLKTDDLETAKQTKFWSERLKLNNPTGKKNVCPA